MVSMMERDSLAIQEHQGEGVLGRFASEDFGAHDQKAGSLRELAERFCVSHAWTLKISSQRRTGQMERVEQRQRICPGATVAHPAGSGSGKPRPPATGAR